MSGLVATFQRELRAYFVSPLAYVILTFMLLVNGGIFTLIVSALNDPRASGTARPMDLFFGGTFLFWVVLLIITPILTMRLISEELRSGTIEPLMTAPVSETEVVVAKYLAALVLYAFLWAPTVAYALVIAQNSPIDWGPVAAGYLGILGIGAAFLAIGVFASSFTQNQIIAAIISFALVLVFFCLAFLNMFATGETVKNALGYVDLLRHMEDFGKGIVDTRRLVYYFTTAAFFLFLTARGLETRKWR